ncbi:hypothetical protein BC936DRAFT_139836 [Jimgerdemannia flammicorona]|uniref:Uncharacterized protein n=1 Tax=Jimgerdemannia flammicorona TaxID=994334 RepID=A0A433B940_9FUNG|nr:hypothetical protein BC936DRAFT_139836 [Jimgerdemannia flammicorona]
MPLRARLLAFLNREVLKTEKPREPAPIHYSARYMTLDRLWAECALVGRTDNTSIDIDLVTNVQARARGYIIRKKIDTFWTHHVAASRIQAAWRGFKTRRKCAQRRRTLEYAANDRILQLERRIDQEAKSREAMEGRFEEVVDELRASKSAEERRLRKELEQMIVQILPQLVPQLLPQLVVVQHQASSGKPARSSKENSTPPPSNKPAPADPPTKAPAGPPCSRTPRAVASDHLAAKPNGFKVAPDQKAETAGVPSSVLVARVSLDKRTVLGPAKATTNVRSGKPTAVRKEPKPSLPIKML